MSATDGNTGSGGSGGGGINDGIAKQFGGGGCRFANSIGIGDTNGGNGGGSNNLPPGNSTNTIGMI